MGVAKRQSDRKVTISFICSFLVRPEVSGLHGELGATVLSFAFPLASLLVLLGVTTVLLRGPIDRNLWAFRLLVAGVLLSVVADLTFGLIQSETGGLYLADADPTEFKLRGQVTGQLTGSQCWATPTVVGATMAFRFG
mgnify:CR=1 FL=1